MQGQESFYKSGRELKALELNKKAVTLQTLKSLEKMGIAFDHNDLNNMLKSHGVGMDAGLIAPLSAPSVATPVQFLQEWLPGFVHVVTAPRRIDELIGLSNQGKWEDEEIVQGVLEYIGKTQPYGDETNIPLSSWNTNFERRSIVRFEEGMRVGRLEEARASAIKIDSSASKRNAATEALEIQRNRVGFFGYNGGANRTYGFLNDPQLLPYVPAPTGNWDSATYLLITADIRTALQGLRTQSDDRIDPKTDQITMAIASDKVDYLTVTSDFGNSVQEWLTQNYPNVRVISAPELNGANGGDDVAYYYAESTASDYSTDDRRTFIQVVPTKFQTLGVEQRAKSYVEDYSNATAGSLCKRPWAVYRQSGI